VRLEGLDQLKNSVTSLGIEPATFRLVSQCLNQVRYRVEGKLFWLVGRTTHQLKQVLRAITVLDVELMRLISDKGK
jgi:hypothetical protein